MQERSTSNSSISGFVAGCSTGVLFPLDKLKLHMIVSEKQSRNFIPYYPSSGALLDSMRKKGLRYMYRGMHFQLSASIAWSIYFPIYEFFKRIPSEDFRKNHYEAYKFLVAAQAAVLGNFLSNPLFVIKTRAILMQNSETWFKDTIESLIKTGKVDGIQGYGRGYSIGVLLAFDGTLTMYLYETFKENLKLKNDFGNSAVSGALSKIIACSICFPIVLLKIRLQQEQYISTILLKSKDIREKPAGDVVCTSATEAIKNIWKNEGILGFYRGLPITLFKVIPTSALFFGVFEMTYKFLEVFSGR